MVPREQVLGLFVLEREVALLRLLEVQDGRLVLLAAVQVVGLDEVQHRLDGRGVDLAQPPLEDRDGRGVVAADLPRRRNAQGALDVAGEEVVPLAGFLAERVLRQRALRSEARLARSYAEDAADRRRQHGVAQRRSHEVVGVRRLLGGVVPDRADVEVGVDRHDVADSPDEVLAAHAVVLGPHLERGIGPGGERLDVLLVQRVSVDARDEGSVLRRQSPK